MHRSQSYAVGAACIMLLLAGCGGGGGGSTVPHTNPTATPSPTTTPSPLPTPAAATNTQSITLSNSAATTATLPATGGITPTVTIPQVSAGSGTVSVTVATGSLATMQRTHQAAASRAMTMAGGPYLLQLDFVASQTVTLTGAPGFSLDLTQYVTSAGLSASQAASYLQNEGIYLGIVDGAGNFNVAGPITVSASGSTVTASYTGPATSITFAANEHYTIGVHLGPISAATSSPTPTPTPTPTATATPTATPIATPTATPTPFVAPSISLFQLAGIYGSNAIAQGITADSHGIVWFAENPGNMNSGNGFISTIDAAGTVTTFPYTPTNEPTHPSGVAFGPDGNLWATENCAGADADVFSPTGSYVRSYLFFGSSSTLCGGAWTNQVISGTDGNLWLAEGSQAIGKMTTSGTVTQYTLPNPGYTVGVTNGPNGEVWFAEQVSSGSGNVNSGGVLGKVTSTGQVITYPLNSGEVPGGLTLGNDGNIWFTYGTQTTATGIGKMTPSGVETDYTPSTTGEWGGASNAIVSGPDGKIWSGGSGILMTIDPSTGTTATYPISTSSCYASDPLQMVSVPSTNSIWFTSSSCIGEVVLH